VELGGVRVGSVEAVRWQNGHAVLDVSIDHAYATRLHNDASATIRQHGLLGPKYVDLYGGKTGLLLERGTIPVARVHVTQVVDENNICDGIDQTAVVVLQLDIVMDGNSENLAYILAHSPATILRLRTVVSVSDQLVQGISPGPTEALMVAVMETKSAFSYS